MRTLEKELRDATAQIDAKQKALNEATAKAAKENASNPRISLKARLPSESDDEIVIDDVYRLLARNESFNGSFLGSSSGRPFLGIPSASVVNIRTIQTATTDFKECLCGFRRSAPVLPITVSGNHDGERRRSHRRQHILCPPLQSIRRQTSTSILQLMASSFSRPSSSILPMGLRSYVHRESIQRPSTFCTIVAGPRHRCSRCHC